MMLQLYALAVLERVQRWRTTFVLSVEDIVFERIGTSLCDVRIVPEIELGIETKSDPHRCNGLGAEPWSYNTVYRPFET